MNKLTLINEVESITKGKFTISDLSDEELSSFESRIGEHLSLQGDEVSELDKLEAIRYAYCKTLIDRGCPSYILNLANYLKKEDKEEYDLIALHHELFSTPIGEVIKDIDYYMKHIPLYSTLILFEAEFVLGVCSGVIDTETTLNGKEVILNRMRDNFYQTYDVVRNRDSDELIALGIELVKDIDFSKLKNTSGAIRSLREFMDAGLDVNKITTRGDYRDRKTSYLRYMEKASISLFMTDGSVTIPQGYFGEEPHQYEFLELASKKYKLSEILKDPFWVVSELNFSFSPNDYYLLGLGEIDLSCMHMFHEFKTNPTKTDVLDGRVFETYGEDISIVRSTDGDRVWTVTDSDGDLVISQGMRFVNRLGYMINIDDEVENVDYIFVARDMEEIDEESVPQE